MTKAEFERMADIRVTEAEVLLNSGMWPGAYYLVGYAVECALKAVILKRIQAETLPERGFVEKCYTHNLIALMALANLKGECDAQILADLAFESNWDAVKDWSEASRYQEKTELQARGLFGAVTDNTSGVLMWIRKRW